MHPLIWLIHEYILNAKSYFGKMEGGLLHSSVKLVNVNMKYIQAQNHH